MSGLVEAIAMVTRRPVDAIAAMIDGEAIDLAFTAKAGLEIRERLVAAGLPFTFHSCGFPARFGVDGGLARYFHQTQTNALRALLQSANPQAVILAAEENAKPKRLYFNGSPPVMYQVCALAYVDGAIVDPRHRPACSDLDELEHIFGVLVFDGDPKAAEPPPIKRARGRPRKQQPIAA